MKNKQKLINKYNELKGLSDEQLAMKCVVEQKEYGMTMYHFNNQRSYWLLKTSALEECKLWLNQEED